ncbi:MAG: AMP-binding protein [Burkholderiaceae bacterium]
MSVERLIAHSSAESRIATRAGVNIAAVRFVADATALAQRLPDSRYVLNTCHDRYAFAVAFAAALIAGRTNLLPPSRTPELLAQLAQRYPDIAYVGDEGGVIWCANSATPRVEQPLDAIAGAEVSWPPPAIAREHVAAIAFTSGSTGEPQAQTKTWGGIVDGARAEAAALQLTDGRIEDVVLLGTVSPQHMYGLESTVMMALHGPCALAAEHPLHAGEVIAALSRIEGRRVLITTPVHLRALSESKLGMPALDRVVSATAPLQFELAARCESMWNTRVFEIYGCTETGMVAARRTTDGPRWTAMRDIKIEQRGSDFFAHGGHVQPGRLADRLRLINDTTFELEGRADDVVNIGGKRASLEGLNRQLLSIEGVLDGAMFLPASAADGKREQRLAAVVVAPGRTRKELLAALRTQIDAAFLPRPLLLVDSLPRNAQGKLPRAELLALVSHRQATAAERQPTTRSAVARTE